MSSSRQVIPSLHCFHTTVSCLCQSFMEKLNMEINLGGTSSSGILPALKMSFIGFVSFIFIPGKQLIIKYSISDFLKVHCFHFFTDWCIA